MKWKMLFIACLVASTIGVGAYRGSFLTTKAIFEDNLEPGQGFPLPHNGRIVPPIPDDPCDEVPGLKDLPKNLFTEIPLAHSTVTIYQQTVSECTQAEQEAEKLARELKTKADPAKEAELRKLLVEIFDKRHAAQEEEARELSKKLSKLQDRLSERRLKKEEIITKRVKDLKGEGDNLAWDLNGPKTETYIRRGQALDKAGSTLPALPAGSRVFSTPPLPRLPADPSQAGAADSAGNNQNNPTESKRGVNVITRPATTVQNRIPSPSADAFHLADQWAVLVRSLDALKSGGQQQKYSSDPKTMELEWQLAKVKLREAEEEFKGNQALAKNGSITTGIVTKSQFAVEKARLEVDLAEQKWKLAREAIKTATDKEPARDRSTGSGRSARVSDTNAQVIILEKGEQKTGSNEEKKVQIRDSQGVITTIEKSRNDSVPVPASSPEAAPLETGKRGGVGNSARLTPMITPLIPKARLMIRGTVDEVKGQKIIMSNGAQYEANGETEILQKTNEGEKKAKLSDLKSGASIEVEMDKDTKSPRKITLSFIFSVASNSMG